MEEEKLRFGIRTSKHNKHTWALCFGLARWYDEMYIYANLIKWSIAIGKMYLPKRA